MIRSLPILFAGLVMTAACSGSRTAVAIPTSPSATAPTAVGTEPPAASISVGQSVRGSVALADARCDFGHSPEPCVRFAVVPAAAGVLLVQLTSPGPGELALRVGGLVRGYGVERIEGTTIVAAGTAYDVSVSLHNAGTGHSSQLFELTTSLAPVPR